MSEEQDSPSFEDLKERFIPINKQEIVADLLKNPNWSQVEKQQFSNFCTIFSALYHYKFHSHLEELKRYYIPFDPDKDIVKRDYTPEEKESYHYNLIKKIRQLLNNANYEELTSEDINNAISADSYYGVRVAVDLNEFAEMIVYYRGATIDVKHRRTWKSLYIRKENIDVPIYKRIFLLLKFKTEEQQFQYQLAKQGEIEASKLPNIEKKLRKQIKKAYQKLPEHVTADHIFIKLFKNIPRTDLEMLFPNQNVQLKLFDKIKIAVTGGGGTIIGIISTIPKVAIAANNPIAFVLAFSGLVGIIFRQITNIFSQRNKYMMVLSRNLYFHNLDNNIGVVNYLIDKAEDEEGKEAILAYYFLHTQADKNYTEKQLAQEIESYLSKKYDVEIDFEVDDGLAKLRRENILSDDDNGNFKVLDLHQACCCLDEQWDAFFNPKEDGCQYEGLK
ncbi:MAG: DUF3754 domain-containing protein [Thiomargarita sp.]|nr:DUF3754 domain-containing protein [Thiomargarita sp.]